MTCAHGLAEPAQLQLLLQHQQQAVVQWHVAAVLLGVYMRKRVRRVGIYGGLVSAVNMDGPGSLKEF